MKGAGFGFALPLLKFEIKRKAFMRTMVTNFACLLTILLSLQVSAQERGGGDIESLITSAVTANGSVQQGEDRNISFAKLDFQDGAPMYLAFTAKHRIEKTPEGYAVLLVDFFIFNEKDGKMKSSIFAQAQRFIIDRGNKKPLWIGRTGKNEEFSISRISLEELPFPLLESYSNEIFYSIHNVRKGENLLANLKIGGEFGACFYKHPMESSYNCHYMKQDQCNYSGALELGADNVAKSTRDFRFKAGQLCDE